jgi:Rad3-related DNA helicase
MIKPRKYQKEVVQKVIGAYEDGYTNVLIDAPTGFGKSIVNYVIAKWFTMNMGSVFYTTPQVSLLNQIESDPILDIAVIKGRSNYVCLADKSKSCATGPCMTKKNYVCVEECIYKRKKYDAMYHTIAAMSFAYLIYDRYVPEGLGFDDRELLIVDEGDDLENWAIEFGSFKFRTKNRFNDIDDVIVWAKAAYKKVCGVIKEIEEKDELSRDDLRDLNKLIKYKIKLTTFINKVSEDKRNWVFTSDGKRLIVKPVNAGQIIEELIWSRGEYRLVSSATIIDRVMFCRTTGLDANDTVMIKVPHTFPVENRKVYYMPICKMTKDVREDNYNKIAKVVAKIVKENEGYNGIVHCNSYELKEGICRELDWMNIKYISHNSVDRNDKFKEWIRDGGVFIGVGFERGVDLRYDMCRYVVITKVPYPDLNDIRVDELLNNRKAWNWYRYQAIKNLVQACGRGVRAEDDWCKTYILDESFGFLFRYKSQFPSWFVEAVEVVEDDN